VTAGYVLSTSAWEAGTTLVYGPLTYSYPSGTAGNILFTLTGAPFIYTGGDLIVEVCYGSATDGWTSNPAIQWTTLALGAGVNASHNYRADYVTGCGNAFTNHTGTATTRPRLVVTHGAPATCFAPPTASGTPTSPTSATLNWTAPGTPPSNGYQWEVRTSGAGGSGAVGLTASGSTGAGVLTAGTGGTLTAATTYTLYVRGWCGGANYSPTWKASSTFTTPCVATTVPYTQDFQSVVAPAIPACTSVIQAGTGNLWTTVTAPGFAGYNTACLRYFYSSSQAANTWYFLRALNLTGGTSYRLTYTYGTSDVLYPENLRVAYGTNNTAAAMTNTLATHAGLTQGTAQFGSLDFTPASTGDYYIGFQCYSAADMYTLYLDDITVNLTPTCTPPTLLQLTSYNSNSATFSWTAASPAPSNGYNWEARTLGAGGSGPVGLTASGSVGAGVTTASTGATLAPNTTYSYYVQSNCGIVNGNSTWIGPLTSLTTCPDVTTFPYNMGFNGSATCWQTGFGYPWDLINGAGTFPTNAPAEGSGQLRYNSFNIPSLGEGSEISPPFTFPSDLYRVRFKMYRDALAYQANADQVKVYYNTSPMMAGATLLGTINRSIALSPVVAAEGWYEYDFNMPAGSTGAGRYIILRGVSAYGNNIFVDDFNVEVQPSCFVPTAVTATPTSTTTANISWTAPALGSPVAYEYVVTTSATAPGGTPVSNGLLTTATVGSLTPNTTYYLHVRTFCGGLDYSSWATTSFYSGYCQVTAGAVNTYGIGSFSTSGGLTNISNLGTGANNYYTDYTALSVSQYPGGSVGITINSNNGTIGAGIWVDWNNNLVFEAGEKMYASGAFYVDPATGSFSVPALQPIGSYRMRVVGNWNSTNPTPCGVLGFADYGEAEDYTFSVVPLPTCYPPTGLTVTPVSTTSCNISWTAPIPGNAPVQYYYAVSTSATPPVLGTVSLTTSVLAVPAAPNVTNYLHVRTDCDGLGTDYSGWSTYSFFSGYCEPLHTTNNQNYITNVTSSNGVVNINNNSTFTSSPSGYTDYSAVALNQYPGQVVNLAVDFVTPLDCGVTVYIDWNNDLDFADGGELVYNSAGWIVPQASFTFTVPSVQAVGSYKMRVRLDYISTSPAACGTLSNGEAEDYTINVIPFPACNTVTYAASYTTSTDVDLTCTGNPVQFTSSPAAPLASNLTYRLERSTLIGGPYSTVAGPQATSSFSYVPVADGYYRIVTLCSGSPVAATWVPKSVTISNPSIISTTPGSNCGPGEVILSADQTPAVASVAWYDSPVSTTPLSIGNSFVTPTISSTATYYVAALNSGNGQAIIGSSLTTGNIPGETPYSSLWESTRIYYIFRKSEMIAEGLLPGDITSMAFDVTTPGAYVLKNYTVRIAATSAANVTGGFTTPTGAFTTVYTAATLPIPSTGLNTITFTTPFAWDGNDNIIIELCHDNDNTGGNNFWGTNSTVRYTATSYPSVYYKYKDDAPLCGLDPVVDNIEIFGGVTSVNRPNIRLGGRVGNCGSVRTPVLATINPLPALSAPSGIVNFTPTPSSFVPVPLTASSATPFTEVVFTPPASIYTDAATTGLYVGGTDINGVTQYFAPFTSTVYTATAISAAGCTNSSSFTLNVDASALPNTACAGVTIPVTNTLTYQNVNTGGVATSLLFPCSSVSARQIWYKAIVPASGEVHVVTKSSGVSLTDVDRTNVALFTGVNCQIVNLVNVGCNTNGGVGDYSYAFYSGGTPGDTVYIRVAASNAATVAAGKFKMAVTAGLIWTPTNGDNVALAENWEGGDATALTTPSATQSIIIPAGTTKPKLYANATVRNATFLTASPYFVSTGINLNSFTLSVKKNWILGPVASSSTVLDCNGLVEFNGTVAQSISGRTTFGNLTLNNALGLTLTNTTGVSCILKATLGTLTSGGFLVLRSTAANSAALVDYNGTGTISGNTSVERKIGTTSGYHYLAAPVSGVFVNNTVSGWRDDFSINAAIDNISFTPGATYSLLPSVWEYQEFVSNPNPEFGWLSATSATDAITPLKGFACLVPGNVTVDLLGPLNDGAITPYSVTFTDDGKNLLGNPYPSPISWANFRATNVGKLSAAYTAFVSTGGYAGSYGSWDGSVGTIGVTDRIASSQSFFVTALFSSTITAADNNRLFSPLDLTTTFFGYSYVPDLIRMDITGNGGASQMAVYFDNARSDSYDQDAAVIMSTSGVPTIYSVVENQNLSINAMGSLNLDKVVPMGVKIQTAGTYNLVATDMTSFAPSVIAYLEDTQAGTMTNLRTNPSYSVTLPVGEINNRFFLHFHPAVELNAINETCVGNDGKLVINYPTSNTVNVVIKDANGNVVNSQNNVSGLVTINNLVAGNYVAEMTFGIAPNTYSTSDFFTVAGGNAVYANLSASANTVDMGANTTVNFTATAQGATSFNWNFGDGTVVTNGPANMSHTFAQAGTYNVTFEASNGICNTVATTTVEVTNATGLTAIANSNLQVIGVGSKVTVRFGNNLEGSGNIEVINMLGEVVAHLDNVSMKGTREIEMSSIAAGQYMVKITNNNKLYTEKVYLSRQ
jgi:hypothetical protein